MSTITLPNIRVGSDLQVRVHLKDGGVAIDWSTLSNIKACIYSDAQRALAGRCAFSIDEEDSTLLVCTYAANKPQYLGVNRIVISAKYMGETKTYDKPAFSFVRWTADQEGEEITIDDPDVDVEIDVEDISSSILQEAVDAAFTAADRANDAAAAAEHMVDIHTGPEGKSAYEVAVEEGYTGTEEEWLASLKGDTGETPDISIGTVTTVETGTPAAASMTGTPENPVLNLSIPKGLVGATPNFTVGTVTTGEPGSSVIVTITGTPEAPVLNVTIPQGMQGNTGSSVDYPYELVNNLTTNDATKGLSAAQGVVLQAEVSQLEAKVDEELDGKYQSTATGSGWTFATLSTAIPKGAKVTGALLNGSPYTSGSLFFKDGDGNQYNASQSQLPYTAPEELTTVTLGQTGAVTIKYETTGLKQKVAKNESDIASVSTVANSAKTGVDTLNNVLYGDKKTFNVQGGYNNQSILLDFQLVVGVEYYIVIKPNTLYNDGDNCAQLYVDSPRELIVGLQSGLTAGFKVQSNTSGDLLLFLGRGNMKDTSGTLHDISVEIYTDAGMLSQKSLPYTGEKIQFRNRFNASIIGQLSSSFAGVVESCAYYGGYFFVCHVGLDFDIVREDTMSIVDTIAFGGEINKHGNNVVFSNKRYNDSDAFPLLYASAETTSPCKCEVIRIQKSGDNFSGSVVQTIIAPEAEDNVIPYFGAFGIDLERNLLYVVGYSKNNYTIADDNPMLVCCWNLPNLSDGETITLSKADVLDRFTTRFIHYAQGFFIEDSKLYQVYGSNEGIITVTDLYLHSIVSEVDLQKTINYQSEPEGITLVGDSIYMIDSGFRIYKFDF